MYSITLSKLLPNPPTLVACHSTRLQAIHQTNPPDQPTIHLLHLDCAKRVVFGRPWGLIPKFPRLTPKSNLYFFRRMVILNLLLLNKQRPKIQSVHPPTRQSSIGSIVGSTSTSHFLFRNLYPSYIWDAASSHLHPIIILFFYRLFRKVYAMSNRMYLFLPIDRFLRTRSRNLLMYLDPLVSLRFSSFELASYTSYSVPFLSYQSCLTFSSHPSHIFLDYYHFTNRSRSSIAAAR